MKRLEFFKIAGTLAAGYIAGCTSEKRKTHLVTLSFDDGFRKSCEKIAEIYERFGLSACINVIATGHLPGFDPPGKYIAATERGDFGLWNELQARGHEIMPHSYRHANLAEMPFAEAQGLILKCLDVFAEELEGFDPAKAVFNFPYNASTPELEAWLPGVVMAFRTGFAAVNELPHPGMVKLLTTGYGPENCESHLDKHVELLLSRPSGWLVYNTHGLDDEGWGPIRSVYLERLLERLVQIETVQVVPAGRALLEAVGAIA
ncbi:MAG: polysaccharide deacetylase family protein [Candidatus Glassbacteria bacterium]|nr:polysaccharide deacetylase family protein [Candidatus Glassbacteria bacterium]